MQAVAAKSVRKAKKDISTAIFDSTLNVVHERIVASTVLLSNGDYFARANQFSKPQLASALRVDIRTLQRITKSAEKPLAPFQAEGLVYFEMAMAKAVEVFHSFDVAQSWFLKPSMALGNQKPIEVMSSSFGAQSVIDVLGQIEHGVHV
jgi:putative toxin-antitoxin system antitoxin component (TIGR02293 family)